jgi:DNA repair protein RadC
MKTYKTNLEELTLKRNLTNFKRVKIISSKDSAEYIRNFYSDDLTIFESCFLLLLNNQNNTIGFAKISQGGTCGTVVDVKIICKYVIETLSTAVILCHNHPSGVLTPSTSDMAITNKLKEALKLFDVKLLDHIILTENSYFSFADEGIL